MEEDIPPTSLRAPSSAFLQLIIANLAVSAIMATVATNMNTGPMPAKVETGVQKTEIENTNDSESESSTLTPFRRLLVILSLGLALFICALVRHHPSLVWLYPFSIWLTKHC